MPGWSSNSPLPAEVPEALLTLVAQIPPHGQAALPAAQLFAALGRVPGLGAIGPGDWDRLAQMLARLGIGIEPDPRLTQEAGGSMETAILFAAINPRRLRLALRTLLLQADIGVMAVLAAEGRF